MKIERNRFELRIPQMSTHLHGDRLFRGCNDLGDSANRRRMVAPERPKGGDRMPANNDALNAVPVKSGAAGLQAEFHPTRIGSFEGTGRNDLILKWPGPGVTNPTPVPSETPER